jgi:uncharacterized SAM-binding protein YcdF (DUF218 family)
MFFLLSKILGFFALPSNLAATILAVGVALLFTRFSRAGRRLAAFGVVLLLLAGLSPLGNALIYPLEERFPPWDSSRGAPDGIVVLGGAIGPDISAARHTPDLNESAERLTAVADLARRYPSAHIVYSGGDARLVLHGGIEADVAVELFESFGIPRARVIIERRARNTSRTRSSARSWWIRNRASAGCWSPPAITCRARSASFVTPASRSRLFQSTGARAGQSTSRCPSSRSPPACAAPTPRRANGSGC